MIIECINCNKKFNVDSELIPVDGRQIQCGSCNYIWHYKFENNPSYQTDINRTENSQISILDNEINTIDNKDLINHNPSTLLKKEINNKKNTNKIGNNYIIKFFSYLIVFIISFIALLVLLDTLKSTLIDIFPVLEVFLFNLFETLKDIKLFIIDLT